jgi:hypothetical protein
VRGANLQHSAGPKLEFGKFTYGHAVRAVLFLLGKMALSPSNELAASPPPAKRPVAALTSGRVASIDAERIFGDLSSAVRLFVLKHYQERAPSEGVIHPSDDSSVRISH